MKFDTRFGNLPAAYGTMTHKVFETEDKFCSEGNL